MKKLLSLIILCMPLLCMAQNEWEKPLTPAERLEQAKKAEAEAKKATKAAKKAAKEERKRLKKQGVAAAEQVPAERTISEQPREETKVVAEPKIKNAEDAKYLVEGAVPVVDGKVEFKLSLDLPNYDAQSIYDKVFTYLDNLAQESNQVNSSVALVNKSEHIIAAKYTEWLDFTKSFLMLDRTKFSYTIIANCYDNRLDISMKRLSYNYEEHRDTGFKSTAERLITDEYAVNKKHTKLQYSTGKFRRKTIDRKDELFDNIRLLFK